MGVTGAGFEILRPVDLFAMIFFCKAFNNIVLIYNKKFREHLNITGKVLYNKESFQKMYCNIF